MATKKTTKIHTEKTELQQLVEDIKNASLGGLTPDQLSEKTESWAATLMQLQAQYQNTPEEQVSIDTRIGNYDVLKVLQMGLENHEDYKIAIGAILKNTHQPHIISLVGFLKTIKGHQFFRDGSKKLTEKQKKSAAEALGGWGGLSYALNTSKAVRAEIIGCLLTYAASGKSENDVNGFSKKDWEKQFLDKAIKSDVELALKTSTIHSTDVVEAVLTKISRAGINTIRGRARPDSCVVYNGVINLCNTFSDSNPQNQKTSFIKYYYGAMRAMTKGLINASAVKPMYLVSSPFLTHSEESEAKNNTRDYVDNAKLSSSQRDDLSQANFLGLMGNCSHIDDLVVLFAHNPIIVGGESTDLFVMSEKINLAIQNKNLNDARSMAMNLAMKKTLSLSKSLNQILANNDFLNMDPIQNKGKRQRVDTDIEIRNMISSFSETLNQLGPILATQDKNYEDIKSSIFENVNAMIERAEKSPHDDFKALTKKLGDNLDNFIDPRQRAVQHAQKEQRSLEGLINMEIEKKKPIFTNQPDNLADFSNALFSAFKEIKEFLDPKNGYVNSMAVEKFSHYITELSRSNFKDAYLGYEGKSVGTTRAAIIKSLKDQGCGLMADFVQHTQFLFNEKVLEELNSENVSKKTTDKMEKLVDFLNKKFKGITTEQDMAKLFIKDAKKKIKQKQKR